MKKLKITLVVVFSVLVWHATHCQVFGNTNGVLADGAKEAGYIITLFDFEKPLGTDGYSLESTWGHIAHGVVDNPNQDANNPSDKVYMGHRQAGSWNSGIKFVLDANFEGHGKSKARIQMHPLERPSFVYLKFLDENDDAQVEGWCTWGTFPAGQWSYAVFNESLEGISFRKVEVYFSDDWGTTTAEATTYFDNIELYNDGDEYPVNLFDADKPEVDFVQHYHHVFDTWDPHFNSFWADWHPGSFTEANVMNGYLQFEWVDRRIIATHEVLSIPYVVEVDLDNTNGNHGGTVIRGPLLDNEDYQEAPDGDPGFNRAGIAFYPNADGSAMIVQMSKPGEPGAYPVSRIEIPKPADISTLLGRYQLKIEDFGETIYVYLNGDPFTRIEFDAAEDDIYSSGTVFDKDYNEAGTFAGMRVKTQGRLGIAQRAANIQLYGVSILKEDIIVQRNLWDFEDPDDLGINHENTAGDAVYEDGMLKMTIIPGLPWQEPCVWTEHMDVWSPDGLNYFWMRIKNQSAGNHVGFTAIGGADWYGLHRVDIPTNDDMFRDVIIEIADPARWWSGIPDNLNEIRFDGPKGVDEGVYYIDFYQFVEDFPLAGAVENVVVTAPFNTAYGLNHFIQLNADVVFEDHVVAHIRKEVSWSVSDETVATISETGMLTPLSGGVVTVHATSMHNPDVAGSFEITVIDDYTARYAWEFDDPDDDYGLDLEHPWAAGDASFEDNMLKMTLVPDMPWGEPVVYSQFQDYWTMGNKKYFWMKIKNESAGNDVGFTAMSGDDWFGLHRVSIPTNDDMFREVIIDITDPDRWWSDFPEYLNTIRFDGPRGADEGVYYVDYYRFVEDFPFVDAVEDVVISSPFTTAYGLDHMIQFHADVKFEEHIVAYIKTGVTWSVSDETVATISEHGLLTPVSAGEVTVFATSVMNPDVAGSVVITVLESYEFRTAWEFDDPADTGLDMDHESGAGVPVVQDGMLQVTLVPDMPWQEPNVWSEYMDYWTMGDLKYFWMRIKNQSEGNGVGFTARFGDDWYGVHRINIPTNADEFTDVVIDLSDPASWWGEIPQYINEIRFDGPKGVDEGVYYVDFYRFITDLPPAESIVVSSPFDDIYGVGSTVTLTAQVLPVVASQVVEWSVDDDAIATIDAHSGVLTAVSAGAVVVTATATDGSGVFGTRTINVSEDAMPVSSIVIMGENDRTVVFTGSTLQMVVDVLPLNATDQSVTYSVDQEVFATIDPETGILTGVAPGNVVVTATANDGSGVSDQISIEVLDQIVAWEFETADGWDVDNASNATASVQDGSLVVDITGPNAYVMSDELGYWQVLDLKWVEFRIHNQTGADRGKLTAITSDGEAAIYFPLVADDNQYREVLVNITGVHGLNPLSVVNKFRLDVANDVETGTISFDYIRFSENRPVTILSANPDETTILPFVNFNDGGQGVAYNDADPTNNGGGYRPDEGVDIGGGHGYYNVGWTDPGEWLKYDIRVQESGKYNVTFNFHTIHGWFNEKFTIMVNDNVLLSQVELPAPEDFISYALDTALTLNEGDHVLTFVINEAAGGFDLRNMVFNYDGYFGNNDANLSSITVGGVDLPGFDPNTLQYRLDLPYGTDTTIVAIPSDPNATVSITHDSQSRINIVVTAEDGTTQKTYFIRIVFFDDSTSADLISFDDIKVYPNPARNIMYVDNAENSYIEIYSILGKLLYAKQIFDNRAEIDVSQFENGVYVLRINKDGESLVVRVLVH